MGNWCVGKGTFGVVKPCNCLLLSYVPDDEQVISASTGKHLRVVWTPRYSCDCLLVFRHDCSQLKLIISVIKLERQTSIRAKNENKNRAWIKNVSHIRLSLHSIRKGSSLCPNPFKGVTLRSESFKGFKGVGDQTTVSWSALLHHHYTHMEVPSSRKGSWEPKCPSVVLFEILHSEGPFEVASSEPFSLERPFNMAAMIVFTLKCPSESDISCLERTVYF